MAKKGKQIFNHIASNKITFLQTRSDTQGELLQFENLHSVNGIGPVPHRHPLQEEIFIVERGVLEIKVANITHRIEAGGRISVPANTMHSWRNAGKEELKMITEFRPALHFEEIIETIAALSQQQKVDKKGNPHPIQMSATLNALLWRVLFWNHANSVANCTVQVFWSTLEKSVSLRRLPAIQKLGNLFNAAFGGVGLAKCCMRLVSFIALCSSIGKLHFTCGMALGGVSAGRFFNTLASIVFFAGR